MDVAIVGAGRVGTALAVGLSRAGHRIVGVSGGEATRERVERYLAGVPLLPAAEAARAAELILIATPDDAIEGSCLELARAGAIGPGSAVAHVSGATSLEALAAARSAGATVLSVHPLQTFPDVASALERLPGSTMAVTAASEHGLELGERIARDLGGRPFRLADEAKPMYHAAAVFASNYVVALAALAEDVFRAAGLEDPARRFLPLTRATLDNVEAIGPGAALTGPAARGDAGTVARNLEALGSGAPEAVRAYVELARIALDLAERSGRLTSDRRAAVEEVLARWT